MRGSLARAHAIGVAMALAAGLHKLLMAAVPVNDDFMHQAYARQLLAGEWPVRDFFDYGMGLMYAMSALVQTLFGYRLLSEALLVAVMTAVSTFLVFDLVRRATGSTSAAVLGALLLVVAAPRGYAYPKLVVYAVAASLWWRYVWKPGRWNACVLGLWTAVAFYWRPDHGVYVAVGVTLATIAAHGVGVAALTRCIQSGGVALALVCPYLVFASVQVGGFGRVIQSGMTAAFEEHRSTGQAIPRWPVRGPSDIISVDAAERYAPPAIDIRWSRDSTAELRDRVVEKYQLTVVSTRDSVSQSVRLSATSLRELRALIAEPIVDDTNGLDRGSARVLSSTWPDLDRWRFGQWWLRLRLLPGMEAQNKAGEAAAVLLFALPVVALCAALPVFGRRLPARIRGAPLVCFAAFTLVVDFGLLRTPFHVRAGEAVVLPAIVLGLLLAALLQTAGHTRAWRRWLAYASVAVVALLVIKSLVVAGQSGERVRWLAGDWDSLAGARLARGDAGRRLWSSPPIEYWQSRSHEVTLRFAAYARECLPRADRILVLWFAPEIYYYSDRLMAGRHLFFPAAFGTLAHERRLELEKIRRLPPQIVFTRAASITPAEQAFPAVFELIAGEYQVAGMVEEGDERYQILVRRDRSAVRPYGDLGWPCYQ